jgi:hypothetical protein
LSKDQSSSTDIGPVHPNEPPPAERGISERRFRRPNALKHGAFSKKELLPWEDPEEFEELHRALKDEHEPQGPLQEDCVYTILSCMWRKRRVWEKRNLDIAAALHRVENHVLWKQPPPLMETDLDRIKYFFAGYRSEPRTRPVEDYQQLLAFSSSLYGDQHKKIVELSVNMLPREFSSHLHEKVPPENFESTTQWIVALKREVDGVLLPMVRKRAPDPDAYLATAAAFLTEDRVLEDLAIEERLDAATDRAMKRLYQLKIAGQLRRPNLPELIGSNLPKQLTSVGKTKESLLARSQTAGETDL